MDALKSKKYVEQVSCDTVWFWTLDNGDLLCSLKSQVRAQFGTLTCLDMALVMKRKLVCAAAQEDDDGDSDNEMAPWHL